MESLSSQPSWVCPSPSSFFLAPCAYVHCVCVCSTAVSLSFVTRRLCYCVRLSLNCRGTLALWNVGMFPTLLLVSRRVVRCATQYPAQCLMPGPVLSDWLVAQRPGSVVFLVLFFVIACHGGQGRGLEVDAVVVLMGRRPAPSLCCDVVLD